MTERDALYRDILTRPDDLFLREVYADHLEDAGEYAYAAQIRAELAGAVEETPSVGDAMRNNPKTGVNAAITSVREFRYGAVAILLDKGFQQVKFRRGFVDWVAAPLAVLLEQGPWLVRNHPVTEVEVADRIPRKLDHAFLGHPTGTIHWYKSWTRNADHFVLNAGYWNTGERLHILPNDLELGVAAMIAGSGTVMPYVFYPSKKKAHADLSYAVLKLARSAERARSGSPDVC